MELHVSVLPQYQLKLFEELAAKQFINDFYLAGGTCLGLHIGHRQSIDFDFFIASDFNTSAIIEKLSDIGDYERENEEINTINGSLNGVRISFFGYKYKLLETCSAYGSIQMAGLKDIAAMKLEAIAGRGSKKDFIDLFFLLRIFTLDELFEFHAIKYGAGLSNQYHHLKSLVYFADAENEAMPVMKEKVTWEQVKKVIIQKTKQFKL